MPKRDYSFFIVDIFVAIDLIKRYSSSMETVRDLLSDEAFSIIIIRELEVIGEAMNNILRNQDLKNYVLSKWRDIVDFRNVVAHEYFGISYDEVFNIVKYNIPNEMLYCGRWMNAKKNYQK